jgi:hypothetical protein
MISLPESLAYNKLAYDIFKAAPAKEHCEKNQSWNDP